MKSQHSSPPCWFLFAPGAGASSSSDWMNRYAGLLESLGPVERFDYPYMLAGKKRPDPLPRLVDAHLEALEKGRRRHGQRAVLIGKSMGGRVGCHLALAEEVSGVVCLGYPLRGMSKTSPLRDEVLLILQRPALFIQGTRDRLCPLELLEPVLGQRMATSELHVVPTGDHSLMAKKTYLKQEHKSQEDLEREVLHAIASFLGKLT